MQKHTRHDRVRFLTAGAVFNCTQVRRRRNPDLRVNFAGVPSYNFTGRQRRGCLYFHFIFLSLSPIFDRITPKLLVSKEKNTPQKSKKVPSGNNCCNFTARGVTEKKRCLHSSSRCDLSDGMIRFGAAMTYSGASSDGYG